ncbi:uncharacterized protein LOC108028498 [Drosophila biarmipes]|uniref:uncharacterized protein LOC108028498 n=1 Tax=Drosophila biarmipes TaxID=125945 RepID=UPI0007E5FA33|nr:uncharacterized protein LOC108028498 [Drosophila biarmipes]
MDHQLCLSWSQHQSTLIGVFENLLGNETLSDCTLAAEGKHLKVHKLVLSAFSPYFATLLQEQYDKHPIFMLKDIKYQQLHAIVLYMYRGEVQIPQSQLPDLLKAAESLQIKGLQQEDHQNEHFSSKGKDISGSEEGASLRHRKISRLSRNARPNNSTAIEGVDLQDSLGYSVDSKPEFDDFENSWTMSDPVTIQEEDLSAQTQQKFKDVDPFMDIPENSTALVEEIKNLRKDIKELKQIVTDNNPKVLEKVSKIPNILVEVSKLVENPGHSRHTKCVFPVTSFEELDEMEVNLESSPEKYIPMLKALLLPAGISKNLKRVVSDQLLFQMNYAGIKDRKGFAVYTNLLNALFEAVKHEHYTWNDFKRDCRMAIYRIKNRVYKNNHFAKKKVQTELTDSENV